MSIQGGQQTGGGGGGAVDSVNGQTGVVVLNADGISDASTTKKFVTAAEKTKLAGIATGATANDTDANLKARANHTGTQSADTITDGTTNKAFTATEKTKLSGVATGATANDTDANLKNRSNHTGTQSADTITDGTTNKAFTATEKTKLAGVATAATANDTDANLKARANHTGTQTASTISDFSEAVDDRVASLVVAGTGITSTYDDTANTLTIAATGGGGGGGQTTVTKTVAPSGGDYASLQAAVADLVDGWEIKVLPGDYPAFTAHVETYANNFKITGAGRASIINTAGYGFITHGDKYTIEGLTFKSSSGSSLGPYLAGNSYNFINNFMDATSTSGSTYGSFNGGYGLISGNHWNGSGNAGIVVVSGNGMTFTNNEIVANSGSSSGSCLSVTGSRCTVTGNVMRWASLGSSQFGNPLVRLYSNGYCIFSNNVVIASGNNASAVNVDAQELVVMGNYITGSTIYALNLTSNMYKGIVVGNLYSGQTLNDASTGGTIVANNLT